MPSLLLYRNSEFNIENRVIHGIDEVLQAFVILAKTYSPMRKLDTCIDDLVGQSTMQLANAEISRKIREIELYMKEEYDVESIGIESIEQDGQDGFKVSVILTDPSGRTAQGEINVLS